MFTNNHAFSRIVRNVLYILLEGNEKGVDGWARPTSLLTHPLPNTFSTYY
jgi:hypothetical protein